MFFFKCARSTQPSLPLGQVNRALASLAVIEAGRAHPCQVSLCDPIWQVTLCSSAVGFTKGAVHALMQKVHHYGKRCEFSYSNFCNYSQACSQGWSGRFN